MAYSTGIFSVVYSQSEVARNCQIVSFTVGDEVVYVFIDILDFLIVVAGSR